MRDKTGKINLILGGSGYGKSSYIFEKIIESSIENPDKNYILTVPEQFTMAAQREIVERHPNHGVLNIDIVSFNRLAFRVFEELGISGMSVLDDTGKTLILKSVIDENKDRLVIYKRKVNQSGFVEEMKSALSELYSYGIDTGNFEEIWENVREKPYVAQKLKDISIIYQAFKEKLGEKYITKEEILSKLSSVIERSQIIENSCLFFDGFTGFTPVQSELLGKLLDMGNELFITVTISAEEAVKLGSSGFLNIREQELFNLSKNTVNKLFALAADRKISIRESDVVILNGSHSCRFKEGSSLDILEKKLFRNNGESFDTSGDSIKIYTAQNPVEETEAAAGYIAGCVREKNMRYRDFAVITGAPDTYRKPLEKSFKDNGIPFFMDSKRSLLQNPCVNAIRWGIQIIQENFSYESVFGFLRCYVWKMDKTEIDRLENYVLEYGIRGYKNYSSEFKKKRNAASEKALVAVNGTRAEFMNLIREFREEMSGRDKTVRDYTEAIYRFTEKLEIYETLKAYEEEFKDAGNLSLAKEYSQTYGQILELFDKMVELMGDMKISVGEYRKMLDAGFQEIKVGVIPLNTDTVVVGDIERTRLSQVKVLIVLGVNDGVIPSVASGGGLFTQKDRNILKASGVELSPTIRENIFIQRFYLYQNLTKPSEKLILSYSLSSPQGKSLRQSYLIGNICELFKGAGELFMGSEKKNIYTETMGLRYVARHFVNSEGGTDYVAKELFSYFYENEAIREKLMRIVEGGYYSPYTGKIDEAVAKSLYGEQPVKSATRLEKYAACGYAHFLMYGLKLAERRVYEISAANLGTIYHRIIEIFSREMKKENESYRTLEEKKREELLERSIDEACLGNGGDVFFDSERNKYLLNIIKEVSSKTIWAISEHIKAGNFEPEDFEMTFSDGRIDRVDTMENEGSLYVKVIDYKSGNKKFDMDEVMNGLQIQLIYYMDAALNVERTRYDNMEAVPAGAFYFQIKSPYIDRIEGESEDEKSRKMRQALLAEYKMTGLVNSDFKAAEGMDKSLAEGAKASMIIPIKGDEINIGIGKSSLGGSNFNSILTYVKDKADKMCDRILEGDIETNPYAKTDSTSCDYCGFKGICTFNEKYTGGKHRRLKRYEKEEILDMIKAGEGSGN